MDSSARRPVSPRELRTDVWLAAALLIGAIVSTALGQVAGFFSDTTAPLQWGVLYAAAITVPLAVRRRFPVAVMFVVAIAYFVGMSARVPEFYVGQISLFVSMFTVGAWLTNRRRATVTRVLVIVGMFVWLLATTFQEAAAPSEAGLSHAGPFSPFAAYMLIQFLVNAAFFGGAYYMGDRAYASAIERAALEERTAELERERELTAAQAVALDRVRLARELHDVVAHHVSAMGVQAGAARTVLAHDPGAARDALVTVETSARAALSDLRHLLETLRTPDAVETPAASTVKLDDLGTLVEHANTNGLPTQFTVVGREFAAPEVVQVNLYRIAQEALTNARRHGGPSAHADIRLRYGDDDIELEISNRGRMPIGGRAGLGTIGMRERATASGGTIDIRPRPGGGMLVRVHVPLAARSGRRRPTEEVSA